MSDVELRKLVPVDQFGNRQTFRVEEVIEWLARKNIETDPAGCQRCGHYGLDHQELGGPCSWGMGFDNTIWCRCTKFVKLGGRV